MPILIDEALFYYEESRAVLTFNQPMNVAITPSLASFLFLAPGGETDAPTSVEWLDQTHLQVGSQNLWPDSQLQYNASGTRMQSAAGIEVQDFVQELEPYP